MQNLRVIANTSKSYKHDCFHPSSDACFQTHPSSQRKPACHWHLLTIQSQLKSLKGSPCPSRASPCILCNRSPCIHHKQLFQNPECWKLCAEQMLCTIESSNYEFVQREPNHWLNFPLVIWSTQTFHPNAAFNSSMLCCCNSSLSLGWLHDRDLIKSNYVCCVTKGIL